MPLTDQEFAEAEKRSAAQIDRIQLEDSHSHIGKEASFAALIAMLIASLAESYIVHDPNFAGFIGILGAGVIYHLIGLNRRSELRARWQESDQRVAQLTGQL